MQEAKIENSERDESKLDAKNCGGGGGQCVKYIDF